MSIVVLCLGVRGDDCPTCPPVIPGTTGDKGEDGHPGKNCFLYANDSNYMTDIECCHLFWGLAPLL